jgi:hypothetical protein
MRPMSFYFIFFLKKYYSISQFFSSYFRINSSSNGIIILFLSTKHELGVHIHNKLVNQLR